jgi:hypothetical protein
MIGKCIVIGNKKYLIFYLSICNTKIINIIYLKLLACRLILDWFNHDNIKINILRYYSVCDSLFLKYDIEKAQRIYDTKMLNNDISMIT